MEAAALCACCRSRVEARRPCASQRGLRTSRGPRSKGRVPRPISTNIQRLTGRDVINDTSKAHRLAPQAEAFALVVVTHVHNPVPRSMHNFVKYGRLLSRVADREKADANLRASLELLGPTYRRGLGTETALRPRASVDAWLCGPISPQTAIRSHMRTYPHPRPRCQQARLARRLRPRRRHFAHCS